jgi:hypothetical protein
MSRYAAKSAVTKYCKIPLTVRLIGIAQKVSAVICLKTVIDAERSKRRLGAQLTDAAARTFRREGRIADLRCTREPRMRHRSELTFKQALFRAHLCSVEGSSEPNV